MVDYHGVSLGSSVSPGSSVYMSDPCQIVFADFVTGHNRRHSPIQPFLGWTQCTELVRLRIRKWAACIEENQRVRQTDVRYTLKKKLNIYIYIHTQKQKHACWYVCV